MHRSLQRSNFKKRSLCKCGRTQHAYLPPFKKKLKKVFQFFYKICVQVNKNQKASQK